MLEWAYVNTIDRAKGMVTVQYAGKGSISSLMPCLSFGGEYYMPNIGDKVAVIKSGKGASDGVVLGTFFNEDNEPKASSGVYKDMGDGAYLQQSGGALTLADAGGDITVTELIATLKDYDKRLKALGG